MKWKQRVYNAHTGFFLWFARAYARFFPDVNQEKILQRDLRERVRRVDRIAALRALLGNDAKIHYLDVGARGGVPTDLLRYKDFFTFTLSDPEEDEATKLEQAGYAVVRQALADAEGRRPFYVTAKRGSSSLLKPSDFLRRVFMRPWTAQVVSTYEVETTTIDAIERERGVRFDWIKLDTQGSELAILRGAAESRPLVITTEVSTLPLYEGQGTAYDIVALMRERGYLILDWSVWNYRPVDSRYRRAGSAPVRGLPLHGDIVFAADWTHPSGREMIEPRDRAYAAILTILGFEEILRLALDVSPTPNSSRILRVLDTQI